MQIFAWTTDFGNRRQRPGRWPRRSRAWSCAAFKLGMDESMATLHGGRGSVILHVKQLVGSRRAGHRVIHPATGRRSAALVASPGPSHQASAAKGEDVVGSAGNTAWHRRAARVRAEGCVGRRCHSPTGRQPRESVGRTRHGAVVPYFGDAAMHWRAPRGVPPRWLCPR